MKKSKLIELLQEIDGDPDILLWNGMVSDWMDILGLQEVSLERSTLKGYSYYLNLERTVRDNLPPHSEDECKKFYKTSGADQWEVANCDPEFREVRERDLKRGFIAQKSTFIIDAKPRGKKCWDRQGSVRY